jgi:hypothetical protein
MGVDEGEGDPVVGEDNGEVAADLRLEHLAHLCVH